MKKLATYTVTVSVMTTLGLKTREQCSQRVTIDTPSGANVIYDKKVKNITKGIENANNTTAAAVMYLSMSLRQATPVSLML